MQPVSHKLKASIPSLITLTGMTFGFLSVIMAARHDFEWAFWLIVYASLTDKLDGFAARRLDVVSEIGMQLDSLSDLITFGVAPAAALVVMAHVKWGVPAFSPLGIAFMAAALTFLWASAVRLAKFNVITHDDHEHFIGVATTHAATILATLVLSGLKYQWSAWFLGLLPAVYFGMAALMVSRVRIPKLGKGRSRIFRWAQAVLIPVAFVLGFLQLLPEFLLTLAVIYLMVGVVETLSGHD